MIQDISPKKFYNEYSCRLPKEEDYLIAVYQGRILIKNSSEGNCLLTIKEYIKLQKVYDLLEKDNLQYLISIDEKGFFLLEAKECGSLIIQLKNQQGRCDREQAGESEENNYPDILLGKAAYQWKSIQIFRTLKPSWMAFAAVTSMQLAQWYEKRRYCGACGSLMKKSKKERAMYCPECGNIEYPKICPAVIIALVDKNRILVSRYAAGAYKKYALLAGFMEIGETFEDTVRREVMEEVGLKVKNIVYYKSQPWAFTDTVLAGFYCELDGDDKITMDIEELSEAFFIARKELPQKESDISLTAEMMELFRRNEDPFSKIKEDK